jgi:hypothetical protein
MLFAIWDAGEAPAQRGCQAAESAARHCRWLSQRSSNRQAGPRFCRERGCDAMPRFDAREGKMRE